MKPAAGRFDGLASTPSRAATSTARTYSAIASMLATRSSSSVLDCSNTTPCLVIGSAADASGTTSDVNSKVRSARMAQLYSPPTPRERRGHKHWEDTQHAPGDRSGSDRGLARGHAVRWHHGVPRVRALVATPHDRARQRRAAQ